MTTAPITDQTQARESSVAAEQLAAVMAVSAAVAEAGALDETLDQIAFTAAAVVGAKACAIYLRESEASEELTVVASYGLSRDYVDALNSAQPLVVGKGPSGLAIYRAQPIEVEDILSDPLCEPWRPVARRERVRAMVSVPLRPKGSPVLGGLNAYRESPGPWTSEEVNLLALFSDHAAIAIRTADLLDDTRRQVAGLSLMVRSLRAQAHEHSNRLHAIYGLLTLGEAEQARRMIASIEEGYHSIYGRVTGRIENPTLAGFLVAESAIALQSGIQVTLDARSRLHRLPEPLNDLDALTLLGNLVQNAVDAVSDMPRTRRKVTVTVLQDDSWTTFRVRDWGKGLPPNSAERIFDRDFTTKDGHSGIGLSLIRNMVKRSGGTLEIEQFRQGGIAVTVKIPS
jgi:hypothetical protein